MSMTTTDIRKYAFIKVAQGDYLLPSNDGRTCLRFYTYEEDGSLGWDAADGVRHSVVGTFWAVSRKPMPTEGFMFTSLLNAWLRDDWGFYCNGYRSRREALEQVAELVAGKVAKEET